MKVSVIIPVFNEEKIIADCLKSLQDQSWKGVEIILVDDGSTDNSVNIIEDLKLEISRVSLSQKRNVKNLKLIRQNHLGAGAARNLGVKEAKGEILVFVDADMTFDKKFIEMLTKPIRAKQAIGTFSKNEIVLNKDNIWSKCWNINKGLPTDKMHPKNYPDTQPVFRAILRKEFLKVGGFDLIGYIDDHTLSEKLGVKAVAAKGAFFYHRNPDSLSEVFRQSRWIGKSEYKRRKIRNENIMRTICVIRYSLPLSLVKGLWGSIKNFLPAFLIFKIIYDLAVEISLFKSFFKEQQYK